MRRLTRRIVVMSNGVGGKTFVSIASGELESVGRGGPPGGRQSPWRSLRLGFPIVVLAIVWVDQIRRLSFEWSTSDQYSYGWCVPFLCLVLFWLRWSTRPEASTTAIRGSWTVLALACALFLGPVRVLHEVNPDWPLMAWASSVITLWLAAYLLGCLGGFKWVWHFGFAIAFLLVSVRWPWRLEFPLTRGLMNVVASLTVEILGWLNVPAVRHGAIIELGNGAVGIDEACSGIRSLQSTVMVALLLGEVYLLSTRRRAALVLGGMAMAFLLNVGRTLTLSWRAASAGIDSVEELHDTLGLIVFGSLVMIVWAAAVKLDNGAGAKSRPAKVPSALSMPTRGAMAAFALALLGIVVTEGWFRYCESHARPTVEWTVQLPKDTDGYQTVRFTDRQMRALKHDEEECGTWSEADGIEWIVYYLRWLPGAMVSRMEARSHRPEHCLPSSGRVLMENGGVRRYQFKGLEFPLRRFTFGDGPKTLHVFFCLFEDGSDQLPNVEPLTYRDRLHAALGARRNVGQRSIQVAVSGYPDMESAEKVVVARLGDWIRFTGQESPRASLP